ncbi:Acetylornithine aminotransferase [bacterium HR40]|nr:Acetylornithine aminotransferase [bacterium HR40]
MTESPSFPVLLPVYRRVDLVFTHGEGCFLFDSDGRKYLDFASGIAVDALGHAHPQLVAALTEQAKKLWHVSNLFRIAELERLAERLVAHSFADTVFVCNSGAEAVEACIKMVRRYFWHRGEPHRYRIVTFEGSFHGRTLATISAAGAKKLTEGFEPLLDGFDQVPFLDRSALERAISPQTAAIMIEPVQGEGGVRPAPPEFLRELRALCDRFGLLLVYDEVQCGMGRTGRLFAHEWAGAPPDIMALAKGLGGGFPIGACLATARAAAGMTPGSHGSTFGGNPLACAVANAVLDAMLAPGFLEGVAARGRELRAGLEELRRRWPQVLADVRGLGLMLGIRPVEDATRFAARLREHGLLSVPAGDNVVRLLPPLIVGREEVELGLSILEDVCREAAR